MSDNIYRITGLLEQLILSINFINLVCKEVWMCCVPDNGSIKYRWVFLGMSNRILWEIFQDFSSLSASILKRCEPQKATVETIVDFNFR